MAPNGPTDRAKRAGYVPFGCSGAPPLSQRDTADNSASPYELLWRVREVCKFVK